MSRDVISSRDRPNSGYGGGRRAAKITLRGTELEVVKRVQRRLRHWQRSLYRWLWLRRKGRTERTTGVYIFGAQRSGTTMLVSCFENSPEFDVYGEKSIAFEENILRSVSTIRDLINRSDRPFVVFKPLSDSHRAVEIISAGGTSKAVWMYRHPHDRANSAVERFGDANQRFLRDLLTTGPSERWEARGLTVATIAALRRLDAAALDDYSAAGAFWFLRNQLYFDQQLDRNPAVLLLKYEMLVTNPESTMMAVCDFIGCEFDVRMIRDIHAASVGRRPSRLSPEVSELCGGMLDMLDETLLDQWRGRGFPFDAV